MDQAGQVLKAGRARGVSRSDVPRLRSLFIDGQRAHAHLRLPLQSVPGREYIPGLAHLTARPEDTGPEDLQPRENDLVPFTFRLLSEAYLGGGGYHLDFSREGVLEQALALFLEPEVAGSARQSPLIVVRDHSVGIEDRIGLVRAARWSPAAPEQDLREPGIDAELHINWKLAGDVVRRLLHDPPLLEACSVSLGFNWEKSHLELEDWQFWKQLGEEVDGSTVRIVVTEILSVEHVGLVFAGADPSARRTTPAADQQGLEVAADAGGSMTASLAGEPAAEEGADLQMAAKAITLTPGSPVWGLLEIDEPDRQLLERRAVELRALAEVGREALADLRQEVRALITQLDGVMDSEPSQGLLQLVEAADRATLRALKEEYTRRLEVLLPARCQVCGSEQVSRRSSREAVPAGAERSSDDPGLYR
ncbi:MAG: hypothetical protein ACETWG_10610 [Candidatus Neomarinimicrobiota bacterium]